VPKEDVYSGDKVDTEAAREREEHIGNSCTRRDRTELRIGSIGMKEMKMPLSKELVILGGRYLDGMDVECIHRLDAS